MTQQISGTNTVVTVSATVSGAPAYEIAGSGNTLINDTNSRISSSLSASAAITISGSDSLVRNNVLAEISSFSIDPYGYNGRAIDGSESDDRIENYGTITGSMTLRGGNDYLLYGAGSTGSRVDMGAGDDHFVTQGNRDFLLDGGTGFDTLTLGGVMGVVYGSNSVNFEKLEIGASVTNIIDFSGYQQITLAQGGFFNFLTSSNSVVLDVNGVDLTIARGSTFSGVTGSDTAERVGVSNGGTVGAVSLKDGNDTFTYTDLNTYNSRPHLLAILDGGAGSDTLQISVNTGGTVDVSNFRNFETINAGSFTSITSNVTLTHADGYLQITPDTDGQLTIAASNSPDAFVGLSLYGGTVTIGQDTTVGQVSTGSPGSNPTDYSQAPGDPTYSTSLVNSGHILDGVRLYLGDDLYDGRAGSVGGPIFGFAGQDTLMAGANNDVIIGGYGADTLSGGGGNDIFRGTRSEMDGDTILDLTVGDRINLTDATYGSFGFSHIGSSLSTNGSSFTLGTSNARLVVAAQADGGTDIIAAQRMTALNDFNGDGHSDILWRHASGSFTIWQVGGNIAANQLHDNVIADASVGSAWALQETFDFNGDGISDLLWRHIESGTWTVWQGKPGGFDQNVYVDQVSPDWKLATVGDFDGDGMDDIIWRHETGTFAVWESTGHGFDRNVTVDGSVSPNWALLGSADFNGDGMDDLLWRNLQTGTITEWWSTGDGFLPNTYVDGSVNLSWNVDALADFNGDGKDDILWRHDGGTISVWKSTGAGFTSNYVDGANPAWEIAQSGDFNDDGKADLLWRNEEAGAFSIWQSTGNGFSHDTVQVMGVAADWHVEAHEFI